MIVEIPEQLAVLLESFVEPRPVVGVQFVARGLTPCDHVRTLQIAHADQPIYEVRHSGWWTLRALSLIRDAGLLAGPGVLSLLVSIP